MDLIEHWTKKRNSLHAWQKRPYNTLLSSVTILCYGGNNPLSRKKKFPFPWQCGLPSVTQRTVLPWKFTNGWELRGSRSHERNDISIIRRYGGELIKTLNFANAISAFRNCVNFLINRRGKAERPHRSVPRGAVRGVKGAAGACNILRAFIMSQRAGDCRFSIFANGSDVCSPAAPRRATPGMEFPTGVSHSPWESVPASNAKSPR